MNNTAISAYFEKGKISLLTRDISSESIPWTPHPQFPGVFLKHLVKGVETGGNLSCHMVRVEPNCTLKEHIHDGKLEIHEIVEGSGTCTLDGRTIPYSVGSIAVIPSNIKHEVIAGNEGIYILAKFSPALL